MSTFVEKLKEYGFHGIGNCSLEQISKAEKTLNLSFPEEYREFLLNFKAGSFYGHEFMGIESMDYLDTISNTLFARENDEKFPKDSFIIEDMGIEGLLTLCNTKGEIIGYQNGKTKKISDSFSDYMISCKK